MFRSKKILLGVDIRKNNTTKQKLSWFKLKTYNWTRLDGVYIIQKGEMSSSEKQSKRRGKETEKRDGPLEKRTVLIEQRK